MLITIGRDINKLLTLQYRFSHRGNKKYFFKIGEENK